MIDYYQTAVRSSYQDYLNVLEADIQHANMLAASIPRANGGAYLQMKLVYNNLAPVLWFLLQWMNHSCTFLLPSNLNLLHIIVYKVSPDGKLIASSCGRRATVREFYAVILPSLQQFHNKISELDNNQEEAYDFEFEMAVSKRLEEKIKQSDVDLEREDECGICLEPCTKMVLPNCCHAMCINCYHDWNIRSQSCPFCRGSLKRVNSGDLWVLTRRGDVADAETVSKEEMLHFYLYISSLPKDIPDAFFLMHYEYLI